MDDEIGPRERAGDREERAIDALYSACAEYMTYPQPPGGPRRTSVSERVRYVIARRECVDACRRRRIEIHGACYQAWLPEGGGEA